MNLFMWGLVFFAAGRLAAAPMSEPLVQPLEPLGAKASGEENSTRRIEDFLNDCFSHPALARPVDLSRQGVPFASVGGAAPAILPWISSLLHGRGDAFYSAVGVSAKAQLYMWS